MVRKLVIMTVSLNGMTLPSWASHLLHRLAPPRPLRQVTSEATLRLEVTAGGQVRLETGDDAERLADGLAGLLLTISGAQADGSWDRMKLCGNPDCLWAFYDRSHSRQGAWCDMASCGNRLKNRSLRARRAQAG